MRWKLDEKDTKVVFEVARVMKTWSDAVWTVDQRVLFQFHFRINLGRLDIISG